MFADILGENIPLIRRFKDPKLEGDGQSASKLHQVYYFASKAEFVEHLSPKLGPEVALNLGFYDPPKSGQGRVPAYFYRDPDGQIPETATLYHEVSHQLLFETAGPNSYTKNAGNFWVFEGLGTYFETVTPQPDGSLEVGGLVGPRIDEAFNSLVVRPADDPDGGIRRVRRSDIPRQGSDLPELPASDGHDGIPHAMEPGSLPRRFSRLRARRISRADQTRQRPARCKIACISRTQPSRSNS